MQFQAILMNFAYSAIGGVMTIFFMYFGFKFFDHLTHFDTSEQLEKDNRAVGMAVMGIFIGIGVAIGLVVGLGLN